MNKIADIHEEFRDVVPASGQRLPADIAQEFFQKALEFQNQWDFKAAKECLLKAVEIQPSFDVAYVQLGYISLQQAQFEEAYGFFKTAEEINPHSPDSLVGLGYYHLEGKRIPEAIAHFKKALAMDGKSSIAHLALGKAYLQNHQPMEALREFQEAMTCSPECAEHAYNERGNVFRKYNLLHDAMREFQNAVEANPLNFAARINLAECYEEAGKTREALALYSLLTKLAGDHGKKEMLKEKIAALKKNTVE